jgi:hypothetical protein
VPHPCVLDVCGQPLRLLRMERSNDGPNPNHLFDALAKSPFRRRFKLRAPERAYLAEKGLPTVLAHAREFIAKRLAPAAPANDGKQTPFRGHPAFVAQHATATCCRSCLAKWHKIPRGRRLTEDEQAYTIAVLERWLKAQAA